MTTSKPTVSPLRQRMIEDMRMRKLSEKTQSHYIRAVRRLAAFLGRSPDTATVEDLRNFQLYLVDHGTSPISLNAAITGLKFFFDVTLDRGELMARMQPVKLPKTLPVVLSREEVARLIAAAGNLKHQTALSVAYATGLRASEVVALRVGDVGTWAGYIGERRSEQWSTESADGWLVKATFEAELITEAESGRCPRKVETLAFEANREGMSVLRSRRQETLAFTHAWLIDLLASHGLVYRGAVVPGQAKVVEAPPVAKQLIYCFGKN